MQLMIVTASDGAPRFYIDGKRVSREKYEDTRAKALREGRLNSFSSEVKRARRSGRMVRRMHSAC